MSVTVTAGAEAGQLRGSSGDPNLPDSSFEALFEVQGRVTGTGVMLDQAVLNQGHERLGQLVGPLPLLAARLVIAAAPSEFDFHPVGQPTDREDHDLGVIGHGPRITRR